MDIDSLTSYSIWLNRASKFRQLIIGSCNLKKDILGEINVDESG